MTYDPFHDHQTSMERELIQIETTRPRYDRPDPRFESRLIDKLRPRAWRRRREALPASRGTVALREAREGDQPAIAALAAGGERPVPSGPALVAEIDGEIVAVAPVNEPYLISNPYDPHADVEELLRVRSQQLMQQQAA